MEAFMKELILKKNLLMWRQEMRKAVVFTVTAVVFAALALTGCPSPNGGEVNTPVVTGVTVTPADATLQQGGSEQFSATVEGQNNPSQAVTWRVEDNESEGTAISEEGLLTVAGNEAATALTVRAVSTADSAKFDTVIVTVTPAGSQPTLTGTVTITGTAKAEQILTAETGAVNGTGQLSYQWKRDDSASGNFTAITGATASTYLLAEVDVGKYIKVSVTRNGYASEVNSASVGPVLAANTVTHTVTFNANGGSPVNNATIADGGTVARPADPTRDGYEFDRWYTDSALTSPFNFDTTITADKTLYAGWKPLTAVSVTLIPVADPALTSQTVTQGQTANFTVSGSYTAYQWYLDGTVISSATSAAYARNTASMPKRPYELSVLVTTSTGEKLSARCRVIVE
jgi:uncharacterized repeat protein (TIGR02543 family)